MVAETGKGWDMSSPHSSYKMQTLATLTASLILGHKFSPGRWPWGDVGDISRLKAELVSLVRFGRSRFQLWELERKPG